MELNIKAFFQSSQNLKEAMLIQMVRDYLACMIAKIH